MIFDHPRSIDPVDQGDIINSCPLPRLASFDPNVPDLTEVHNSLERVVVLTQTCDLAHGKISRATVALAIDASEVVSQGHLKAADVRGPLRAGRVYGWYFLPADDGLGLPEMIVDFRQIFTLPLTILEGLCERGLREARIRPLYREHLARHFGDTYSRIGLTDRYPTE